jgi:hypothetical protein
MAVHRLGPELVTDSTTTPGARLSAATVDKRMGRSSLAWRDFNVDQALSDQTYGRYYNLFNGAGTGQFTATAATVGTAVFGASPYAGLPSPLVLDQAGTSGSATNGQGIQIQATGQGLYPEEGQTVYGHWKVEFKDIATAPEVFFGLGTVDTTFIASDAVSATSWIGFYSLTGGTLLFGVDDGSTGQDQTSAIHTMVDGDVTTDGTGIVDLDFRWVVGSSLEIYVDGVLVSSSEISLDSEPDVGEIVHTMVTQSNGTTDPITHVYEAEVAFKY